MIQKVAAIVVSLVLIGSFITIIVLAIESETLHRRMDKKAKNGEQIRIM